MKIGSTALPPQGFVAFCERRPGACGDDPRQVLDQAARSDADRAALLALLTPGAARAAAASPAAVSVSTRPQEPSSISPADGLLPFGDLQTAGISRADLVRVSVNLQPVGADHEAKAASESGDLIRPELLAMTPELWAKLNNVNSRVNRAIRQRTDADFYGREDFWATPIEDGLRYGDCEDYVLEKQQALLDAGLPRAALNIALVTTNWGESHAVLLVSTRDGEYVLDNLSRWVSPWRQVNYRWRQRQVNGDAFNWAMVDTTPPQTEPESPRRERLLLAALR